MDLISIYLYLISLPFDQKKKILPFASAAGSFDSSGDGSDSVSGVRVPRGPRRRLGAQFASESSLLSVSLSFDVD